MHIEHSDFHDQFVRGLAHKMNNILSLFHGYLGLLLEDEKLAPETVDGLVRIKEGARAAGDLIDRTRSLARPSSVIWRELDLASFLNSIRQTLATALQTNVNLVIRTPEGLPPVRADVTRLRTVLVDLVRNAGEASGDSGTVTVEAVLQGSAAGVGPGNCAAQPMQWLIVQVTDHGHGIPEEIGKRIFEPFYTTRQKRGAAGLGLTVAAGLARQMDGTIRYTSRPGETVFSLLLPACLAK